LALVASGLAIYQKSLGFNGHFKEFIWGLASAHFSNGSTPRLVFQRL